MRIFIIFYILFCDCLEAIKKNNVWIKRNIMDILKLKWIMMFHWNCAIDVSIIFGRFGIVVLDFDCYTGDRSSILTHRDSLGKWMNLTPASWENWVVSSRCYRTLTYIVSIFMKMGFSSSCNSTLKKEK